MVYLSNPNKCKLNNAHMSSVYITEDTNTQIYKRNFGGLRRYKLSVNVSNLTSVLTQSCQALGSA